MSSFATIAQTMRTERLRASKQHTDFSVQPIHADYEPRAGLASQSLRASQPLADLPEAYAQTATFFVKLREYLGLTREQIAQLLATHPSVIVALETSNVAGLPPWPETRALVTTYASLAGIDPTPALTCLEFCMASTPTATNAPAVQEMTFAAWPQAASDQSLSQADARAHQSTSAHGKFPATQSMPGTAQHDDDAEIEEVVALPSGLTRIRQGLARVLPRRWPMVRIAAVMMILSVAGLFTQTATLQAAMTRLPAPLGSLVRNAQDAILLRTSSKFEGMPWINVADPRARRSDKLPTKRR